MRKGAICDAVLLFALLSSAQSVEAHGIAGNRFFVGTLTFDDPSVADEAILPNFSTLNGPVEGGNATERSGRRRQRHRQPFRLVIHSSADALPPGPS
jgi:hypothetical protein